MAAEIRQRVYWNVQLFALCRHVIWFYTASSSTSLELDRHRALERARVEAGEGPWPALVELVNVLPDRVQILHKLLVQALRLFEFPLPAQQS